MQLLRLQLRSETLVNNISNLMLINMNGLPCNMWNPAAATKIWVTKDNNADDKRARNRKTVVYNENSLAIFGASSRTTLFENLLLEYWWDRGKTVMIWIPSNFELFEISRIVVYGVLLKVFVLVRVVWALIYFVFEISAMVYLFVLNTDIRFQFRSTENFFLDSSLIIKN